MSTLLATSDSKYNILRNELTKEMIEYIEKVVLCKKQGLDTEGICWFENELEDLRHLVTLPTKHPNLFPAGARSYSSFLLYGPPGTGKTCFAKKFAERYGATFFSILIAEIVSMYNTDSYMFIKHLFNIATLKKPSVILIDQIEYLVTQSNMDNDQLTWIEKELVTQINNISSNNGIFVIAATNAPYVLDNAFIQSFDQLIYLPLPTKMARYEMFRDIFKNNEFSFYNLNVLASKTEGFSGTDIDNVVRNVNMAAICNFKYNEYFRICYKNDQMEAVYIPCHSFEKGAVKMNIRDIPPGCLSFTPTIKFEDVLKSLNQSNRKTSLTQIRKIKNFAKQWGQLDDFNNDASQIELRWWEILLACCYDLCL